MPNLFPTQNLPLMENEILSKDPERLLFYLRNLVQRLESNFAEISNIVNQKGDNIASSITTFTPVVVGSTVAGTGTYDSQVGIYALTADKLCWFTLQLEWDAGNHTGTGNVTITGMPKTSATTSGANLVFVGRDAESGGESICIATMSPNSTTISSVLGDPTWEGPQALAMADDHTLTITGVYRTS